LKDAECTNGVEFFRQTRRFSAGILCVFQGKATQYGGKRPAKRVFCRFSSKVNYLSPRQASRGERSYKK
jgi:hypothetical protein